MEASIDPSYSKPGPPDLLAIPCPSWRLCRPLRAPKGPAFLLPGSGEHPRSSWVAWWLGRPLYALLRAEMSSHGSDIHARGLGASAPLPASFPRVCVQEAGTLFCEMLSGVDGAGPAGLVCGRPAALVCGRPAALITFGCVFRPRGPSCRLGERL